MWISPLYLCFGALGTDKEAKLPEVQSDGFPVCLFIKLSALLK